MLDNNSKIYVAGHNGMVGSALVRSLNKKGYNDLIMRSHNELDLSRQEDVELFFKKEKPDAVFLAAAKVGGINASMHNHVDFLMDNLIIQYNVIKSSFENDVEKLVFLGSSCIYPGDAKQPMKEEYLLNGPFEPTNEGYSLAKVVGLKTCEFYNKQYGTNYISVMPPNLFGINDDFDLETGHIVAALIRKMHEAKINNQSQVEIWGTGNQRRELMFVDDMADATVFAFENYNEETFVNVGVGVDYTVKDIAEKIKKIVGFEGELYFNTSKPDGMFRKVMDVSKFEESGWKPKYSLEDGLRLTYEWYLKNINKF